MPLDANEEAQFQRIAAQLSAEEPALAQDDRRRRSSALLDRGMAVPVLVLALAALPVALVSGLYPLGLVGYAVATLAAVRVADDHLARVERRRAAAREAPVDEGPRQPTIVRGAFVAATVALFAVVALGATVNTDREPPTEPATVPAAPATNDEGLIEREPITRRSTAPASAADIGATPSAATDQDRP